MGGVPPLGVLYEGGNPWYLRFTALQGAGDVQSTHTGGHHSILFNHIDIIGVSPTNTKQRDTASWLFCLKKDCLGALRNAYLWQPVRHYGTPSLRGKSLLGAALLLASIHSVFGGWFVDRNTANFLSAACATGSMPVHKLLHGLHQPTYTQPPQCLP